MGHDVDLLDDSGHIDDEFYISFNFGVYEDYWHISDSHGRRCKTTLFKIQNAIKWLREDGIEPGFPPGMDAWSVDRRVFLQHLIDIEALFKRYPNSWVFSDQCHPTVSAFSSHERAGYLKDEFDVPYKDDEKPKTVKPPNCEPPSEENPDPPQDATKNKNSSNAVPVSSPSTDAPTGKWKPSQEAIQRIASMGIYSVDGKVVVWHPTRGKTTINSFAKASEMFATAVLTGDQRQMAWLYLATQMPDTPGNCRVQIP
jgi:hypothetical protein